MVRTNDRELVRRLRSGDEEAVRALAEEYGAKIYQLAFRYMRNREDAEEVAQDVLWKVYRKIQAFRGDSALSSWIYRITFNAAMSRLRRSRLARTANHERDRLFAADAAQERPRQPRQPIDTAPSPHDAFFTNELRRAVAAAIRELPEIYRAPIVLRDVRGLTTEEAGKQLKLKDQTLKSRLHRGRLMLRARLRPLVAGPATPRGTFGGLAPSLATALAS
jgi:RNA polymerase sigma-70 factor (ECF subfamily)